MNKTESVQPDTHETQNTESFPNLARGLEDLPDAELQALIKKAQTLLVAREQERRKEAERKKQQEQQEALREIQRLAKQFGLKVDVTAEKRKPGRPRKTKNPAGA